MGLGSLPSGRGSGSGMRAGRGGIRLACPDAGEVPLLAQYTKGLLPAVVASLQFCPPAALHSAIALVPAWFSVVPHPAPALLLSWLIARAPQAFSNHKTSWQLLPHAAKAALLASDRLLEKRRFAPPSQECAIEPNILAGSGTEGAGIAEVGRGGIRLACPDARVELPLTQNVEERPELDVATRQFCPPAAPHSAIALSPAWFSVVPHPAPALLLSALLARAPQAFWNHRTSWQLSCVPKSRHAAKAVSRTEDRLLPTLPAQAPHELPVEYANEPYVGMLGLGTIGICGFATGGVGVVSGGVEDPPPPPPPQAVKPASATTTVASRAVRLKAREAAESVRSCSIVLSPFPAGPAGSVRGVVGRQARVTVTLKVRSDASAGLVSSWKLARADVAPRAMVTTTGSSS